MQTLTEDRTFRAAVTTLAAEDWARVRPAGPAWDAAWERALDLGAETEAEAVMPAARRAGASVGQAALAGAAAAALELADALDPDDVAVLCAPFAGLVAVALPAAPVAQGPRRGRRLLAWCHPVHAA